MASITNLTIFNGNNTQEITLVGLTDQNGNLISTASITATLAKRGVLMTGSSLTFSPVSGTPGSYVANLVNFDGPIGPAELVVVGSNDGVAINLQVFVTIATRSM
jgi:hypothetical protein